ncbi:hypothetical protein NC653_024062 [Populus alba x Populus x berolinensis]|uniref:Uncharacterized protein n=1 Tax=Populus alba x Populus x berolinensis TaxID=444605 RepID=A0AAD6QBV2_9ROSI|nr:hypothetical protein NC653_024062 [Populus alba x Populus x berolinensis]
MVVVLVGGTLTVEICSHWSRGPDFREPSYSRAIAYATLCCSGFNHLLLSLSIPNCLFSHIVKFDEKTKILYEKKKQLKLMLLWVTAQQWRWKIFEQCQRYWILATAFTEESCLLRARQPSSMLDLAKGNEKVKSGRCLARYKISSYIMTLMHGMIMIAQS